MSAYLRGPDRNVCLRWLRANVPQVVGVIDTSALERDESPERDDDEPNYDAERPLTPLENWQRNDEHNVP